MDFITPSTPCSLLRYDASSLRGLRALGAGSSAGAETVGELAVDGLEVAHAAGAGGLPALGLLAPVDCVALVLMRSRIGGWSSRLEQCGITYTSWS